MTNEELVRAALEKVGGKSNVLTATNCMTRLRVRVKDDAKIDDEGLKAIEGVMGIVHDRTGYVEIVVGPGKCRKCADICRDMGIPADAAASTANDWQTNKAAVKAGQKQSKVKELFKTFGDIFIPLIPGVVASGLCAGINSLIGQVVPNYADIPALALISTLLGLMNTCFLGYLTAWVGYRAAEKFGGTPILGGMLGMITGLDGINKISSILGLFNEAVPLDSILRAGRGGVLAVVQGESFADVIIILAVVIINAVLGVYQESKAEQAIAALKAQGVRTIMLTGDSETVASEISGQLGLDEYHAQLLPADKVNRVEELLATKGKNDILTFAGDGINDAPVLMRADVGIAMGAMGSDAAIEAADVVLMDDDPAKISLAMKISRKCMHIVYQNIVFALAVKAIFLLLGAFGIANMWWAVFADVGVMILAVLNAMRMLIVEKN